MTDELLDAACARFTALAGDIEREASSELLQEAARLKAVRDPVDFQVLGWTAEELYALNRVLDEQNIAHTAEALRLYIASRASMISACNAERNQLLAQVARLEAALHSVANLPTRPEMTSLCRDEAHRRLLRWPR